jgi:hypothetical protein
MSENRLETLRVSGRNAVRALFVLISLGCSAAFGQAGPAGTLVADPNSGCKVWDPHPMGGETVSWTGTCVNGLAQGPGSLQWLKDGRTVEKDDGEWDQGRQSGQGTQDWKSGRYQGDLVNGEPHGHGVMTLQSARYEGAFRNGKPNGQGTVTNLEGVFKGLWKDGCLADGKRKITFAVSSVTCR